jgi:hypothetical protein
MKAKAKLYGMVEAYLRVIRRGRDLDLAVEAGELEREIHSRLEELDGGQKELALAGPAERAAS